MNCLFVLLHISLSIFRTAILNSLSFISHISMSLNLFLFEFFKFLSELPFYLGYLKYFVGFLLCLGIYERHFSSRLIPRSLSIIFQ